MRERQPPKAAVPFFMRRRPPLNVARLSIMPSHDYIAVWIPIEAEILAKIRH
jgi:hypothetical protein